MPRERETDAFLDEWKKLWKPDSDALGGFNGATCDPTRVHSRVVEWAKHNCSHKPHFIKIINNNAANGRHSQGYRSRKSVKLTVPSPFVKEHFRELKRVVTLENDEGKAWKVSFGSQISSHPNWQQGWRRLAIDHDLHAGEVIVFVLVGNSRFHFTRFDEDGNMLSEKGTHISPLAPVKKALYTTHSAFQSHEKPDSVTDPEDSLHGKGPCWRSNLAAACSTQPSSSELDGLGHETPSPVPLAPAHKSIIAEARNKRNRLLKVEEIMSEANSNDE